MMMMRSPKSAAPLPFTINNLVMKWLTSGNVFMRYLYRVVDTIYNTGGLYETMAGKQHTLDR